MNAEPENFQALRDAWALKAPTPLPTRIGAEKQIDAQANPHNESYLNKKPHRSEAEIISDLAYSFADTVLETQYGQDYIGWLFRSHYIKKWNVYKKV